jgi:phage gpG-like protein
MANEVKSMTNKQAMQWLEDMLNSDMSVHVGIVGAPETAGADSGSDFKKTHDGFEPVSLFTVAAVHEFGSPKRNIPERSYLRSTFDENKEKVTAVFIKAIRMKGAAYAGSKSEQKEILSSVGQWLADKTKAKFTNNAWTPLKDPTRGGRNKLGRARPLIDTGQLRASISYQVVEGDAK